MRYIIQSVKYQAKLRV